MEMVELIEIARQMGIKGIKKMNKTSLIHEIQRTEGNFDCYGTDPHSCGQPECLWLEDCLNASKGDPKNTLDD